MDLRGSTSNTSKKLQKATIGKYVDVTGSTKYYLQAKLKDGQTGYRLARPNMSNW